MVSVAEAMAIVLDHLIEPEVRRVPVAESVGQFVAEDVFADRALPPGDRVTMDGIAINFTSWSTGQKRFRICATLPAGFPRIALSSTAECIEVMTGALLPEGTTCVIPYEEIELNEGFATITAQDIREGQNIHREGSDARKGQLLITKGVRLSPSEVALLASVGKHEVDILSLPEAAIISSGDELVAIDAIPEQHQVRRSNSYAILAAMGTVGWNGTMFHFPDEKEKIISSLQEIMKKYKVLILSGGVSKGRFDFIPEAMESIGVSKLFHRVNQKPGKPFWFGASREGHVVFALPGNPVSTYMCFYRYIRPWLLTSLKTEVSMPEAVLAEDFKGPAGMTYFLQVNVRNVKGILTAYPQVGGGSGDFANLSNVTGFLELDGNVAHVKGSVRSYFPFRSIE